MSAYTNAIVLFRKKKNKSHTLFADLALRPKIVYAIKRGRGRRRRRLCTAPLITQLVLVTSYVTYKIHDHPPCVLEKYLVYMSNLVVIFILVYIWQ